MRNRMIERSTGQNGTQEERSRPEAIVSEYNVPDGILGDSDHDGDDSY